jgi:hypothetical protein
VDEILQEVVLGSSGGKITSRSNTQCLLDCLFETMMGLLDISLFMSNADMVPGRLHALMGHPCLVSKGPLFFFRLAQVRDCRTQMIATMLLWNPADLPPRFFDPLRQGFQGLAEADTGCLHMGVGEHEMIDQVGKWLSCHRDAQIVHRGKIGWCSFSWGRDLFKEEVFFWSVQRSPPGKMPPQRAILPRAIPIRMPFTPQSKQRGRLESRIAFEWFPPPGPVRLEGIGACLPIRGVLEGAGQGSRLFVFAGGTLAHASTRRCLFLRHPFSSFRHRPFDLKIVFHMTPPCLLLDGVMPGHSCSLVEENGLFVSAGGPRKSHPLSRHGS